jgi:hypothetical protein
MSEETAAASEELQVMMVQEPITETSESQEQTPETVTETPSESEGVFVSPEPQHVADQLRSYLHRESMRPEPRPIP